MTAMSAAATVVLSDVNKRYAICHLNGSALLDQSRTLSVNVARRITLAEMTPTHMNGVIDITGHVRLLRHMST